MAPQPRHAVAVIGGATAGAEMAGRLAEQGVAVAVFEQNPRPYGKIEDGLPRSGVYSIARTRDGGAR